MCYVVVVAAAFRFSVCVLFVCRFLFLSRVLFSRIDFVMLNFVFFLFFFIFVSLYEIVCVVCCILLFFGICIQHVFRSVLCCSLSDQLKVCTKSSTTQIRVENNSTCC